MTDKLQKLVDKIENDKVRAILSLSDRDGKAFYAVYVDPAIETVAQEFVDLEAENRRLRDAKRGDIRHG